ncbi:MAG: large conductance mechanosensitive channel protein MscL [Atopobiaceae bacterium]|nr:large conductance mechanosensitive channel protein MscL [Atopobiaceae bacterium]
MKKFFEEFKEFIQQGNVMDMAIGIIIGGAFTTIVTSLVNDIINPFIKLVFGGDSGVAGLTIPVAGTERGIDFGAFISAIINFLIIAFVVFCMVKALNKFMKSSKLKKDKKEAAAPQCPHCLEEVKEGATRCPHCTGEIPGGAHAA